MTVLFDTSALIAAHTLTHPHFAWASAQMLTAGQPALTAHSLAEFYGVTTASPQFRLPPPQAVLLLEQFNTTWQIWPSTPEDYVQAAQRCRNLGLQGGAIYDTLLAVTGIRNGMTALVTLNPKHFRRLGEDVKALVICPE